MSDQTEDVELNPTPKVATVSAIILGQFFDALAQDAAFSEVASKLRKIVLEDGVFSESAIREILFPRSP